MRRAPLLPCILAAACSGPALPGSGANPASFVVPATPAVTPSALTDVPGSLDSALPPYPTLATAGATSCTIRPPVLLDPRGCEGYAIVGFRRGVGLGVWKREQGVLAIQRLALDGSKLGSALSLSIDKDIMPTHIFPVDMGFMIVLQQDSNNSNDSWWAFIIDREGHAVHPPAEIGHLGTGIHVGQPLDGSHIGLIVYPARNPDQREPGVALRAPEHGPLRTQWHGLHEGNVGSRRVWMKALGWVWGRRVLATARFGARGNRVESRLHLAAREVGRAVSERKAD